MEPEEVSVLGENDAALGLAVGKLLFIART